MPICKEFISRRRVWSEEEGTDGATGSRQGRHGLGPPLSTPLASSPTEMTGLPRLRQRGMDQCRGRLTVGFIYPSLSHRIRSPSRRRRRRAASLAGGIRTTRVRRPRPAPGRWIGTTAYRCSAPVDDRWDGCSRA
jgi:hypothetical protein